MSVRMIEACKRLPVTSTQKLVLLILADCHNDQTDRCDPSGAYLMETTGLSNKAIFSAITSLESAGHLSAERRYGARNAYRLHPQTSEPRSHVTYADPVNVVPKPVNEGHGSPTSEPRSPVNHVHTTSEPGSLPPVNVVPKPVNDVHTNRKNQNGTGKEPETKGVLELQSPEPEPSSPPKPKSQPKTDWRAQARAEADEASATPLPLLWSQPLRAAVLEFFAHRHDLACKPPTKSDCRSWTVRAAASTISGVEKAVSVHGEEQVIDHIHKALAGGWQGLNLDGIRPAKGSFSSHGPQVQKLDLGYRGQ